jgi:hypothetical protein
MKQLATANLAGQTFASFFRLRAPARAARVCMRLCEIECHSWYKGRNNLVALRD